MPDKATASYRPLTPGDYEAALLLYRDLTNGPPLAASPESRAQFQAVLDHAGTTVWGAELTGQIAAMVTLHLLPNMTYGGRPYALIENVVTAAAQRGKGLGQGVMSAAIEAAWEADAYKIMLLTGQARGAKGFYETLGFSDHEKYGLVLRRDPKA